MCILVANVASGLVAKFTIDLASNISLLKAMVAYQKDPRTKTYEEVKTVLQSITDDYNKILFDLNGSKTALAIFDSDVQLLWFTGPKILGKYVSSIYSDIDYSKAGQSVGTVFKQFEDGFKLQGGYCGGFPLYAGGRPSFTFATCFYCSITENC